MEIYIMMVMSPLFLILHAILRWWKIGWAKVAGMIVSALLLVVFFVRMEIFCNECTKTFALCCEGVGFGLMLGLAVLFINVLLLEGGSWLIERLYARRDSAETL